MQRLPLLSLSVQRQRRHTEAQQAADLQPLRHLRAQLLPLLPQLLQVLPEAARQVPTRPQQAVYANKQVCVMSEATCLISCSWTR